MLQGMIAIFDRGHALELFLNALGVVPVDIVVELSHEVVYRRELFAVVHLGFEMAEEVFHDRIIEAIALA